jgi:protein-tyrosine-phosphatase
MEVGHGHFRRTIPHSVFVGAAATLLLFVAGLTAAAAPRQAQAQGSNKAPTVLFMCAHGAAKSILASAYFQHEAKARGLNVHVMSAGIEPDAEVSPAVASHLKKYGYEVPITKPRQVTADDMAQADVVISIGCDLKGQPASRGTLQRWDDVPAPSEDFAGADTKIKQHVLQLVDELLRQRRQ